MHELVYLNNNEAMCSSVQVAEKFNKRHADVIRAIENQIKNDSTQNCVQCFKIASYKDDTGKKNKMYHMNRDGFTFLVMGFTGKEANKWKWDYINAFNTMESILSERRTTTGQYMISDNRENRLRETDEIKKFVEYAKEQGSSNADRYYVLYSKLANKSVGIADRNLATISQLQQLTMTENIILNQIRSGMERKIFYKEIYQECKRQIELFKNVAYL